MTLCTGWRDIQTAPKDGTNILVWAEGFEWPEVVRYELYEADIADEIGSVGFWRYSDVLLSDVAEVDESALTHWMPIPEAPTLNVDKAEVRHGSL